MNGKKNNKTKVGHSSLCTKNLSIQLRSSRKLWIRYRIWVVPRDEDQSQGPCEPYVYDDYCCIAGTQSFLVPDPGSSLRRRVNPGWPEISVHYLQLIFSHKFKEGDCWLSEVRHKCNVTWILYITQNYTDNVYEDTNERETSYSKFERQLGNNAISIFGLKKKIT